MKDKTIKDIKQYLQNNEVSEEDIEALKADERVGVQALITAYEKRQKKLKEKEAQFKNMLLIEKERWQEGYSYIAGVDEAGRGPLAGPVVAAAVILPKDFSLIGINDSKVLSEQDREIYDKKIKDQAVAYHISFVHAREIDRLNILEATKFAMIDAINHLQPQADFALIDAVDLKLSSIKSDTIIKGDSKSASIAAASILAKVARDHYMLDLAKQYPEYHFERHKGYGTADHLKQLEKHGVSPIHRQSFAPVKRFLTDDQ